jgi:hypothetical protein
LSTHAQADTRFQRNDALPMAAGSGLGGHDAQGRALEPGLLLV